jgi:ADP-heptose:LPS heptosyltransferase
MGHAAHLSLSFIAHLIRIKWLSLRIRIQDPSRRIVAISLIENFGDIVACEPVVRYVKEKHPDAFIIWLVKAPYRDLVAFNPSIDRVLTVCCLTEWIWLSKFDLFDVVVDLHMEGRVCQSCKIHLSKRTGNTKITHDNYYDIGGLLSAFSQSAGLPELSAAPKVYIPDSVRQRINAKRLPQHFVTFHCEAIEECRGWSVDKWKELAERMTSVYGMTVVEVGKHSVLSRFGLGSYVNLCGQLELLETAEVIKRSSLFVGIDSGPAHFANALDVRGVVLLGHYHSFKRYLPYSGNYTDPSKSEIVYGDGPAASIDVGRVLAAVKRQLGVASDCLAFSQVA